MVLVHVFVWAEGAPNQWVLEATVINDHGSACAEVNNAGNN